LSQNQAEALGLAPYSRMSRALEKACLRLSANESFQDAEEDIAALRERQGNKVPYTDVQ